MERVITIGEVEIPVKSTAASLISYRREFGRDGMKDLMSLTNMEAEDMTDGDVAIVMQFFWIYARAANAEVPPYEEWLESLEVGIIALIGNALPQLVALMSSATKTNVTPKK